MFIARISKGRTIREFLLSVLLVPTLLTFIWLTIFGNTALYQEMVLRYSIVDAVNENVAVALFVMLHNLPLSFFTSLLGVLLIITFFCYLFRFCLIGDRYYHCWRQYQSAYYSTNIWAVTEGLVAIVLLLGGGLIALQTASITTGLFFVSYSAFHVF